jgi:F-type H+-transporting ATPase subunit delta
MSVVNGTLDAQRARLVANLVAASHRTGAARLLAEFRRRIELDTMQRAAHVVSAVRLDARTRAEITEALSQRCHSAISPTFDVDPALIGGTCVTIGSEVYDGSVRARLAELEHRF